MFRVLTHMGVYACEAVLFLGHGVTDGITFGSVVGVTLSAAVTGWCLSGDFWLRREGDYASFVSDWMQPPSAQPAKASK